MCLFIITLHGAAQSFHFTFRGSFSGLAHGASRLLVLRLLSLQVVLTLLEFLFFGLELLLQFRLYGLAILGAKQRALHIEPDRFLGAGDGDGGENKQRQLNLTSQCILLVFHAFCLRRCGRL